MDGRQGRAHRGEPGEEARLALVPGLVSGEIDDAERQRRWRQLEDMYLAQQLSFYPPDYLRSNPTPERLLETVERFEEDLTDATRVYSPITAAVHVGDAISVSPARDRGAAEDPVMAALEKQLRELIAGLIAQGALAGQRQMQPS